MPIGDYESAGDVYAKLMHLGAKVVLKSVKTIATGDYELKQQDEALVTKAPKIFKETCELNFNQTVKQVYDFVRGMSPYPAAWTTVDEKQFKIIRAEISDESAAEKPGTIVTDNKKYLKFACIDGYLVAKEVKMTGKKQMEIGAFLNGYTLNQ